MNYVILLIVGLVTAGASVGLLVFVISQAKGGVTKNIENLGGELEKKKGFKEKIESLFGEMIDLGTVKELIGELGGLEESLKAERGRITITQAELETVETRLRELEEIERELEASALETKEELNILKKKEGELKSKNDELKEKIASATAQLESILSDVELSSQAKDQINSMQTELLGTLEKIDILFLQIEEGNEQYFILKKRYDALDIEYAQLYEKFSLTQDQDQEEE